MSDALEPSGFNASFSEPRRRPTDDELLRKAQSKIEEAARNQPPTVANRLHRAIDYLQAARRDRQMPVSSAAWETCDALEATVNEYRVGEEVAEALRRARQYLAGIDGGERHV